MTRADDLRADLVQKVNAYLLDNLEPELAEEENEALLEAGDIVDLVLQAAYERTMTDLAEIGEAMRQAQFAARRPDGSLAYEPEPTQQTWWETWPATALVHAQERYAGTATDVNDEVLREARMHSIPQKLEMGIPVPDEDDADPADIYPEIPQ